MEKSSVTNIANPIDIDYWRQLDLFDPIDFKTPIHIIGAGATGSYITYILAKMGIKDITVYDFDRVEVHNLPNQIFGVQDVGKSKVRALQDRILNDTNIKIKTVNKKVEKEKFSGIVFLLTDTMKSRKDIFESSIVNNINVKFYIETRMAISGGYIFSFSPNEKKMISNYRKTLYSDEEAERSPCSNLAISPTVSILAGLAAFTLINFVKNKSYSNQVLFSLSPFLVLNKNF